MQSTQQNIDVTSVINLQTNCLALYKANSSNADSTFTFCNVAVFGKPNSDKQRILSLITGLSGTNLLLSRTLHISYKHTKKINDYVRLGGFGSATYKVKNLNKRLLDENDDDTYFPFKIDVFSNKVMRECY